MKRVIRSAFLVAIAIFILFPVVASAAEEDCLNCHGQPGFETVVEDKTINLYVNPDTYAQGLHKDTLCSSCHPGFAAIPHEATMVQTFRAQALDSCKNCHEKAYWQFSNGPHGKALASGNKHAPNCAGCHDVHAELKATVPEAKTSHERVGEEVCGSCHKEPLELYLEGYHGKALIVLGYQKAASCPQCHGAHTANPLKNKNQAIEACNKCHDGANENFIGYTVHANENNSKKEPILFAFKWIFTILLVVVFAVFYSHSALWAFRDIVENRKKKKQKSVLSDDGSTPVAETMEVEAEPAHEEEFYRFNKFHIAMHWLMMISFMLLVFTGMPLRYRNATWAKAMMNLFGGVGWAGFIHRVSAAITFVYFLSEATYGVVYCFILKKVPIFGPDSMVPRIKDGQDIVGMIKYFFGRGPKPDFDRFTYWEKFDYLAVFWGMVMIGLTGLFLAFPTFFAKVIPGKVLNVSTIMHSDEAVLAAGFIFVVHWFNTHWRPGKFPMDSVVFTGRMTKEEMIEERATEWQRMLENPDLMEQKKVKD